MKRIALLFVGGVRECLNDINHNIAALQKNLEGYDLHTFFSTWFPQPEKQFIQGNNYTCNYDMSVLQNQLQTVDTSMYYKQKNLTAYHAPSNGYPPLFTYQLIEIAKSFRRMGETFDYIVKTRHDNMFTMKNLDKYMSDDFTVLPLYWIHGHENDRNMLNDHFFITSYRTFMKYADLTDEDMRQHCIGCHNCEQTNARTLNSMSGIRFMDTDDITKYSNRNLPERRFVGF